MPQIPIYTIGYGNRPMKKFIELLKQYNISYLIDIRSRPYSRFNPDFSKEALEKHLRQFGIRYVFMGDTLGGRPDDGSCYEDGRVDYAKIHEKPFFQQGITRIQTAWEKQLYVALMCSEAKPHECHRGKLVGNTLLEHNIAVAHIDERGKIKEQPEINRLLTDGQSEQQPLFGEQPSWLMNEKLSFSRKKYTPQGEQI